MYFHFILILFSSFSELVVGTSEILLQDINNSTFVCTRQNHKNKNGLIKPYIPKDYHDNCHCEKTSCTCCEYDVSKICITVQYFEVLHIPAAVELTITYNDEKVMDILVNATHLPCIHLPFIDSKTFSVCLQLYDLKEYSDYVKVCIKLIARLPFFKVQIPFGCVKVPKMPGYSNLQKQIQRKDTYEKYIMEKEESNGTYFTFITLPEDGNSEDSSGYAIKTNVYLTFFMLLTILKNVMF